MYRIKLTKGLSYDGFGGKIRATKSKPVVSVEDKGLADAAVATGYFALVESTEPADTGAAVFEGNLDPAQLKSMTVAQLKKLAADMEIDTNGFKGKDDYVKAISAVLVKVPEPVITSEELAAMDEEALRAFAAENGITLDGCEGREDVLEAISVALGGSYTMIELQKE